MPPPAGEVPEDKGILSNSNIFIMAEGLSAFAMYNCSGLRWVSDRFINIMDNLQ